MVGEGPVGRVHPRAPRLRNRPLPGRQTVNEIMKYRPTIIGPVVGEAWGRWRRVLMGKRIREYPGLRNRPLPGRRTSINMGEE